MEIWKAIANYDNYYVSSNGNVRNADNYILKTRIINSGYYIVNLSKNGKKKTTTVHRLAAAAFIENLDNKPYVNHKDNNKLNNKIENLRWVTQTENNMNANLKNNNSSGVKGVDFCKNINKWRARIRKDGIEFHLGHFNSIEEAAEARLNMANKMFGVFKNSCEGVNYGAKPMKIYKAKPVKIHVVEPVIVPIKVDVHQIFNKIKQLNEHYEEKKLFYQQQLQQVINMKIHIG